VTFHLQLGNLGEWAAAAGTTAAVVISAWTVRQDHQEKRQREAVKVVPVVGLGNIYVDASGDQRNKMRIFVTNNGEREIRNVETVLFSASGAVLERWSQDDLQSSYSLQSEREPDLSEWQSGRGMRLSSNTVEVTFVDADGKKWLRTSNGKTMRLRGRRTKR
jgi:hypothetical protein